MSGHARRKPGCTASAVPRAAWNELSTARGRPDPQLVRVIHPFHPLADREFELVGYAHTLGGHRVFFRQPGEERVRSMPAEWTDVQEPDPFMVLAAGRTAFRVEDLVALARLIRELEGGCQ